MSLEKKRKIAIILTIIATLLLISGIIGLIVGTAYAVTGKLALFWASLTGILPLSIIVAIAALIVDISFRKEKRALKELK